MGLKEIIGYTGRPKDLLSDFESVFPSERKVKVFAVNDEFIPHMKPEKALKKYKLDADSMYQIIKEDLYEKRCN